MPRNNNEWFEDHGMKTHTGADTAAGSAPAEINVPTATRWQFKSMVIPVVNSAGVADRALTVNLVDANDVVLWTKAFGTLTASQTGTMVVSVGVFTDDTTGTAQLICIPPELVEDMPATWGFTFSYANVQAGDNFGPVIIYHKALSVL